MKSFRINQAEYPMVGNAIYQSMNENLDNFKTHFSVIDENYAKEFKNAITDVQGVHAASTGMNEQTSVTKLLTAKQTELVDTLKFVKDYAFLGGVDEKPLKEPLKALRSGDTEEGVKATLSALAYYTSQKEKMTSMPAGFLEKVKPLADEVERLNNEQNAAMNFRASLTKENRAKYDALDEYISTVCRLGKRLFKGTPKENEFTVSKILSRIRVAPRKEGDSEVVK